jgi:hypothetical protein
MATEKRDPPWTEDSLADFGVAMTTGCCRRPRTDPDGNDTAGPSSLTLIIFLSTYLIISLNFASDTSISHGRPSSEEDDEGTGSETHLSPLTLTSHKDRQVHYLLQKDEEVKVVATVCDTPLFYYPQTEAIANRKTEDSGEVVSYKTRQVACSISVQYLLCFYQGEGPWGITDNPHFHSKSETDSVLLAASIEPSKGVWLRLGENAQQHNGGPPPVATPRARVFQRGRAPFPG